MGHLEPDPTALRAETFRPLVGWLIGVGLQIFRHLQKLAPSPITLPINRDGRAAAQPAALMSIREAEHDGREPDEEADEEDCWHNPATLNARPIRCDGPHSVTLCGPKLFCAWHCCGSSGTAHNKTARLPFSFHALDCRQRGTAICTPRTSETWCRQQLTEPHGMSLRSQDRLAALPVSGCRLEKKRERVLNLLT